MQFRTKSYPLDCPEVLWNALTRAQHPDRNINDELIVAIAAHVDESGVETEEQEQTVIEAVLEAD